MVVVEEGAIPVRITTPWSTSGRISEQATELDAPLLATVGSTNSGCEAHLSQRRGSHALESLESLVGGAKLGSLQLGLGFSSREPTNMVSSHLVWTDHRS